MKKYLIVTNRTSIFNGLVSHSRLVIEEHEKLMEAVVAMMNLAKSSCPGKGAEIISNGDLYVTYYDAVSKHVINDRFVIEEVRY